MPRSPDFTEDEKARISEARKRSEEAQEKISTESYGSKEYWKLLKFELGIQREIEHIRWPAYERYPYTKDDSHSVQCTHHATHDWINSKYDTIVRREERHKRITAVLSLVKTDTLATARAAYVELFMDRFRKSSRKKKKYMREDLKRVYGAQKFPGPSVTKVWCPVGKGGWVSYCGVSAVHLVPQSVGQNAMDYMFGKYAGKELNTARNALWIPCELEERLDNFQVTIVPADEPGQWKFFVVDREIGNALGYAAADGYVKIRDMHGTKLVFLDDDQPRARYFYFHYLCSMLNLSRKMAEKGSPTMHVQETEVMLELSRAWRSPEGSYICENIILGFVERLGDSIGQEEAELIRSHSAGWVGPHEAQDLGSSIDGMEPESDEENDDEDLDHESDSE